MRKLATPFLVLGVILFVYTKALPPLWKHIAQPFNTFSCGVLQKLGVTCSAGAKLTVTIGETGYCLDSQSIGLGGMLFFVTLLWLIRTQYPKHFSAKRLLFIIPLGFLLAIATNLARLVLLNYIKEVAMRDLTHGKSLQWFELVQGHLGWVLYSVIFSLFFYLLVVGNCHYLARKKPSFTPS